MCIDKILCIMQNADMDSEIANIRNRLGLTQEELAERLDVNPTTVWRWENGRVQPSGATMIALRSMINAVSPPEGHAA